MRPPAPCFPTSAGRKPGSPLARIAVAVALAACALPAFGDVIDVAPGGATTVYSAPGIFGDDGVRPILSQRTETQNTSAFRSGVSVENMISVAAERYAIDALLLRRVAWQESRFQRDAVSSKGAFGVMQLMAGTARDLGVDRYDLPQNILGGAAYLRQMLDRYSGDTSLALAAYNAGPNAVDRYRGIPPFTETNAYLSSILGRNNPAPHLQQSFVVFIDH